MLKDAALLQLDLLLAALEHDLILKDSSLYNVQFTGARALFIDVGSFERLREDELWVGYRSSSSKRPPCTARTLRSSRNRPPGWLRRRRGHVAAVRLQQRHADHLL